MVRYGIPNRKRISNFNENFQDGNLKTNSELKFQYSKFLESVHIDAEKVENRSETCKHPIWYLGRSFRHKGRVIVLPCGLTLGSHIRLVGRLRAEFQPKIALMRDGESAMVSQFKVELLGLKTVEGEEPPRLLHFNPRLRGDWSGRVVIELNTCYRITMTVVLKTVAICEYGVSCGIKLE